MAYGKHKDWWDGEDVVDTLRLSIDDYTALIAEISGALLGRKRAECREHERFSFYRKRCVVRFRQVDQQYPPLRVYPHNISAGGASLLHGFFVSAGTNCELAVQALDGSMVTAAGTVVRCRHLNAKVHELGICFGHPLDLTNVVKNYTPPVTHAADVGPLARFAGHVLYVDDCLEDRELFEFVAGELGVEPHVVSCENEVSAALDEFKVDLVLVKLRLPGTGAPGVAAELRRQGYPGAIHAVSCALLPVSGEEMSFQNEALRAGCNGIIHAPLTQERLIEVFESALPRDFSVTDELVPIYSTHWGNTKMRPLITKFVTILESRVRQLDSLLAQQQVEAFRRACQQLCATSASYGFEEIARELGELEQLVATDVPAERLKARMAQLARLSAAARMIKK